MTGKEKFTPPTASNLDRIHTGVKIAANLIPMIGGSVSELFSNLVKPSLQKRQNEWSIMVGEELIKLSERIESLEALQSNEYFIDIAIEATRIALTTSNKTKLESLKNVILNAAVYKSHDEDKQKMYLRFIDEFTELHILFMESMNNPLNALRKYGKNTPNISIFYIYDFIKLLFPALKSDEEFITLVFDELIRRKLIIDIDYKIHQMELQGTAYVNSFGQNF